MVILWIPNWIHSHDIVYADARFFECTYNSYCSMYSKRGLSVCYNRFFAWICKRYVSIAAYRKWARTGMEYQLLIAH